MNSKKLGRLARAILTGDFDFKAPSRHGSTGLALFLAGVGTGVVVGMFFAPSSGEELRSDLKARAREGYNAARSKAQEFSTRPKSPSSETAAKAEQSTAS
jgi:YtxH-like protein